MALIPVPLAVRDRVVSLELSLDRSGEVVHRNRSGAFGVYQFGRKKWLATAVIGPAKGEDASEIEAFVAEMSEADNWTEFTLSRNFRPPGGLTHRRQTVVSGSAAAGYLLSGPLATMANGNPYIPRVGEFVRAGSPRQSYMLRSLSPDGLTVGLSPREALPVGAGVALSDALAARLVPGDAVALNKELPWSGGWTLRFEEYLQ